MADHWLTKHVGVALTAQGREVRAVGYMVAVENGQAVLALRCPLSGLVRNGPVLVAKTEGQPSAALCFAKVSVDELEVEEQVSAPCEHQPEFTATEALQAVHRKDRSVWKETAFYSDDRMTSDEEAGGRVRA